MILGAVWLRHEATQTVLPSYRQSTHQPLGVSPRFLIPILDSRPSRDSGRSEIVAARSKPIKKQNPMHGMGFC
jgi:hypothetical protein